jgi:hypothetical protein
MAIVELDREPRERRPRRRDGGVVASLLAIASLFVLAVWLGRPAGVPAAQRAMDARSVLSADPSSPLLFARVPTTDTSGVGMVLSPDGSITTIFTRDGSRTLAFRRPVPGVDLAALPDRLANEAAPATLTSVIRIRGTAGIASAEAPAVVWWTEGGFVYWLQSGSYTVEELTKLADELQMQPSPDEWRR